MGLDITAYSGLTKIENPARDQYGDLRGSVVTFFANASFPGREEGVDANAVYSYSNSFEFRAGSYSGYNAWREWLAQIAGYPAIKCNRWNGRTEMRHDAAASAAGAGPFYELLHFSDCEGVIGHVVSAKLAKDFAEFQAKADAAEQGYLKESYAKWRKAFEIAANNGAVKFH